MLRRLYSTKRIAVIGSGQMGVGIAYVAAVNAKLPVTLIDTGSEALSRGTKFVDKLLGKAVAKGRMDEAAKKAAFDRISTSDNLAASVSTADFIIEAVPEIVGLKQQIFGELAKTANKSAILATNTSSISITKIAQAAKGAEDRVIGVHFMNPVPVQKGVEVIKAYQTSDATHQQALQLVSAMGKVPSSSADSPGFLANRILIPYINEAARCLETGIGSAEDIDNIMVTGCAMPMGPLKLADFIGLDTCVAILEVMQTETGDAKFAPAIVLKRLVDAGHLGVKSGKGIYDYAK